MSLIFYTNPQSRGQIVRWMLEEIGQPYEAKIVDYAVMGGEDYRRINPMMKVPALVHNGKTITECAAICAYLADAFPEAGLAPSEEEKADYYRWLFFAAGPIEQAVTVRAMGWEVPDDRQGTVGFGSFARTIDTLAAHFDGHDFVCGDRFTAADIYVGSQVLWGLMFKTIPERDSLVAYAARLGAREAYQRAKAIDMKLIEAAAG